MWIFDITIIIIIIVKQSVSFFSPRGNLGSLFSLNRNERFSLNNRIFNIILNKKLISRDKDYYKTILAEVFDKYEAQQQM